MKTKTRMIAHYLPQFHIIPENEKWWGKGFTEWRSVSTAKPLFKGHYQPQLPGELGFYDLLVPETREAQAHLAKEHGIEGFLYWHYWFNGEMLLERPFNEVLKSGKPDFPFALAWAVHDWTGEWSGGQPTIIKKQTFGGMKGYKKHFDYLIKAFHDNRYITVDGKPLFYIFIKNEIPDLKKVADYWKNRAVREGLKGLYLVAHPWKYNKREEKWDPNTYGFDAVNYPLMSNTYPLSKLTKFFRKILKRPNNIYLYKKAYPHFILRKELPFEYHPAVIPNWDNSPRVNLKGMILHKSTPELWRKHLKDAMNIIKDKPYEHRILFVKSWNEWAECNYLEPDLKYGRKYLEVVKEENCIS